MFGINSENRAFYTSTNEHQIKTQLDEAIQYLLGEKKNVTQMDSKMFTLTKPNNSVITPTMSVVSLILCLFVFSMGTIMTTSLAESLVYSTAE